MSIDFLGLDLEMKNILSRYVLSALILFSSVSFFAFTQSQEMNLEYQISVQDSQGNEIGLYNNSYALIIGVSDYTAGWPKLSGVSVDIIDIERVLIEHGFEVTVVKDPDKDRLVTAIEIFISKYGHGLENRLLIYFAGHGHTIKLAYGGDMGYIVPADAPNPNYDKQGFLEKAIDMRRFDSFARIIESKHALFLFDSCFSGSIFAVSRAVPEVISYKTSRPVRQFITAGSADELVPDESIFKSQFISGLQGEADMDKDGYVTGTELGEFLQTKVINYSEGSQHPQYGKIRDPLLDKGDIVFVVSHTLEEQVTGKKQSLTSEFELEFWRSTKESNSSEAYESYMKKFPDGFFSELAKQRIKKFQEENVEVGNQSLQEKKGTSAKDAFQTVRLIKLSPDQIMVYRELIKQQTAVGLPEDITIQGQINLTLTVNENGKISIESINESVLKVTPSDKREYIREIIQGLITRIVLDPPKDRGGNPVRVIGWRVSYSCKLEKGRLVLNNVGI